MSKSLEQKLNELEMIVQRLSAEELPLEEALELYTKGIEISKSCDKLLSAARQKVEMGKMQLEGDADDMD